MFTEVVTKHLMKFEKKINGYFLILVKDNFVYIKNPFTSNTQMLHAGKCTQKD